MLPADPRDDLDEIRELNRLFIEFLRTCYRRGGECLDLDRSTARLLGEATADCLQTLADLPRALFELRLSDPPLLNVGDPRSDVAQPSWQALQLTILHSAWHMSRRNPYAARLFLGLEEGELRFLRTTALCELPRLSTVTGLVACAFPRSAWLWSRLLTETRPESRRQLLLIALQPQLKTPGPQPQPLGQQITA